MSNIADLRAECFAEAVISERRKYAAAAIGNHFLADSEARLARNYEPHVDPRTCHRCGSRWGKCRHTGGEL